MVPSCAHVSKSQIFVSACLLPASNASADGLSEPDSAADDEGSHGAWSLRRVTRHGVVRCIGALLNGKTRGSARSDFELVNAAILQETRRRNATESGEQRKIVVEANRSASVLLETAPQVRRNRDSVAALSFPSSEPIGGTATVVAVPAAVPVAALLSRCEVPGPSLGSTCRIPSHFDRCRFRVSL